MEYLLHIVVMIGIYAALSVSLDLIAGQTGLVSVAHAAFYGVGAYSLALTLDKFGGSIITGVLIGWVLAIIASLTISIPSLRLRADYFSIATFGLQVIFFNIVNNIDLTGGPRGIVVTPGTKLMLPFADRQATFAILAIILAALSYLAVFRISTSPMGRVLRAIREDEIFAKSLGKNVFYSKIAVVAVGAVLASTAGSLYAYYVGFIDPTSFTVTESIFLISMVIIGGAGSSYGPLFAAAILTILPEALRMIGLPTSIAPHLREMIYGGLLVLMIMVRPSGLFGSYRFGR